MKCTINRAKKPMDIEKISSSKSKPHYPNFFPFAQNLQNSLESIPATYSTLDFFDSKTLEENKNPKKPMPVKITDCINLEHLNALIYDFSYFTLDSVYFLALISNNLIYFFDLPKKPNSLFIFRESLAIEIVEKKDKIIESPLEIFKPQILEKEFLNCCEFGYKIRSNASKPNFSENETDLILACGGKTGLIYIITIEEGYAIEHLYGHINEVYCLKFANPNITFNFQNILLSGSKDGSMILWNIKNLVKIAVFAPRQNPHSDVLCVNWAPNCDYIVSVGLESMVKVWSLNEKLKKKIEESHFLSGNNMKTFKRIEVNTEIYKNNEAHKNFEFQIDQIEFYGIFLKELNFFWWVLKIHFFERLFVFEQRCFRKFSVLDP